MAGNGVQTPRNGKIRIRKINYDAFAKRAGKNAYRRAKSIGLPDDVAREFKDIFSEPIPPELRLS